uniref:Uncharacterized protein n=1 Tax=Romanomermis culicivorax TaxID=13658 RepID=A0A915JP88_ROMCU
MSSAKIGISARKATESETTVSLFQVFEECSERISPFKEGSESFEFSGTTSSNFSVPGKLLAISAKVALSSKGSMEPGIELFLFRCLTAFSGFPSKEGETTRGSMEPIAEEMGEREQLTPEEELENEIRLKRLCLRQ